MHAAASFSQRWARDNLTRAASDDELATLNLFLSTCNGDESEASRRARRYYAARGPGGLTHLWHKRHPDDEDILSSCQDALKEDPTPGEEVVFIDTAYPLRFSEVHVINTHRLKTMSLLLLHLGLYPWRRKVVQIHSGDEQINTAMGVDYFPLEGLPYEYGGKAGAMKDLNGPEKANMTLEQPAGEMWQKIREELNENAETKDADLAHIKEWLKKEPHLPDEFDDQRIMTFLRGCKFSLEKTKRKLDMYFTMRAAVPEQMPPLPGLTPNGRRVILMRGLDKDVTTPNVADAFKLALMLGDVRLNEEKEGVAGDVYILDASVATPTHFAKFTPTLVKKFLVCVQEAYPVKLKEVHVINVSPLVDKIVNFVKPFIKEKIRERIFLHSDINDLYKYVPQEMMPTEFGGNAGSLDDLHKSWVKKMEEYTPWFAEQENIKADESLRPGKPTNYDELFGIDGSFRQLVID
ncbi:hypothetical protein MSG28_005644 [Choristoneura fumiferana]|uniref:Uncharacterized protein n=1 Tax=Choristoneura fumiferana TaxID=7141 RepID=A0ACC0L061_CHOFU|nr:hypothetical protein MSG28_005644 [Choristoneura fumiferana]